MKTSLKQSTDKNAHHYENLFAQFKEHRESIPPADILFCFFYYGHPFWQECQRVPEKAAELLANLRGFFGEDEKKPLSTDFHECLEVLRKYYNEKNVTIQRFLVKTISSLDSARLHPDYSPDDCCLLVVKIIILVFPIKSAK